MNERLQKILSARGICSRRKAEEIIEQGKVKVNGKVAHVGQKADPERDSIEVDGEVMAARAKLLYYLLNKERGVEIRQVVPVQLQGKVVPVGRLDKETSGLLLLTNDGPLAYRLTHPKFTHEKEYEVRTEQPIPDGALVKLARPMMILGRKTKPTTVLRLSGRRFSITLTEGRNRQIRRMCQKVGYPVKELKRVRIVSLRDRQLKEGQVRALKRSEVQRLLQAVGLQ